MTAQGTTLTDALSTGLSTRSLTGTIETCQAQRLLAMLQAHLRDHEIAAALDGTGLHIARPDLIADLVYSDAGLQAEIMGPDLELLFFAKIWLDDALHELGASICWADTTFTNWPPSFCVLTVTEIEDITPRLRRIWFRSRNAARFNTMDQMHVRLLMNFQSQTAENAVEKPGKRDVWRVYTIRDVRSANSLLAIDFVLHEADGPGAAWARRARIGDCLGAAGPCGGGLQGGARLVLAGDETALPAIARIVEALRPNEFATLCLEVDCEEDVIALAGPAQLDLRWSFRRGRESRLASTVCEALAEQPALPNDTRSVWAACESSVAQDLRDRLRKGGLPHDRIKVFSFWHRAPHRA